MIRSLGVKWALRICLEYNSIHYQTFLSSASNVLCLFLMFAVVKIWIYRCRCFTNKSCLWGPVVLDFCDCKDVVITRRCSKDVVITCKCVLAPWFILFYWSVIVSVPLIISVNPIIKQIFVSFHYVGANGVVWFQYIFGGNCLIMIYVIIVHVTS